MKKENVHGEGFVSITPYFLGCGVGSPRAGWSNDFHEGKARRSGRGDKLLVSYVMASNLSLRICNGHEGGNNSPKN